MKTKTKNNTQKRDANIQNITLPLSPDKKAKPDPEVSNRDLTQPHGSYGKTKRTQPCRTTNVNPNHFVSFGSRSRRKMPSVDELSFAPHRACRRPAPVVRKACTAHSPDGGRLRHFEKRGQRRTFR